MSREKKAVAVPRFVYADNGRMMRVGDLAEAAQTGPACAGRWPQDDERSSKLVD